MLQFLGGMVFAWFVIYLLASISFLTETRTEKFFTQDWKLITEGYYFCKCEDVREGQEHKCVCTSKVEK